MIGTKEADLVTAVLLYAMRCLSEGDQYALRAMRFGPKEIEALRELNLADLYRVGSLQAHCLTIRLNRNVYWPMIKHLRATRESEELQRDLIQADAPMEMMRSLFGMSGREYGRLRRMLVVEPALGRPPEPDEETSHRLWHVLSERLTPDSDLALAPAEYLSVREESGATLRAIWSLVQRWVEHGDVFVVGEADTDTATVSHPATDDAS